MDENRFEGAKTSTIRWIISPRPSSGIEHASCAAALRGRLPQCQIGAIGAVNRGFKTVIAPGVFEKNLVLETDCVFCGQCVNAPPVGALRERDDTDRSGMRSPTPKVRRRAARPAVRVALGEEFGIHRHPSPAR